MSGKNQYISLFNWQATTPVTGFLPTHPFGGSTPSGTTSGTMASTNTIYSNIIDVAKMDNIGIELNWTGTPTGTISVLCSVSGANFYSLTFTPSLTQPNGSVGGQLVNINQLPFRYIMLSYVNVSGSGSLTAYAQFKDLN